MAIVDQWSGWETRVLRHALRATVREFAEDLGVSPRTVSKWEAGGAGHLPRPELQAALDTTLARATDEQRARFEAAVSARDTPPASAPPVSRDRLQSSPHGPGLTEAAQLRDDVRALAAAYDATPSVSLLAPAARCQAQITHLRAQAPSGPVRRELFTAEAEAATLMGQLVWDASQRRDHTTAGTYLQHAVTVAQQVQDPVTEAHAVLRQSFVALYGQRDPSHGLALADRAACERALGDAGDCFAARTDLDEAADYYTPTQPGRLAGSCYLSLHLPKQAEALLSATAEAMAGQQKVSSLVLGNLALAHISQRQPDAAVASLHTAIDELERTRGGAGLNVVFTAGLELRPWRDEPAVHEVHDRMLALVATT
jgi:transcriptional regulator with XRE-family HTH domain